jgi:glutathione S-transferase
LWYAHWVVEGFKAVEQLIEPGPYAFGDRPTLADIYLVPQVYNARRFTVPLDAFPKILAVDAACGAIEAFRAAAPENQPDAF